MRENEGLCSICLYAGEEGWGLVLRRARGGVGSGQVVDIVIAEAKRVDRIE